MLLQADNQFFSSGELEIDGGAHIAPMYAGWPANYSLRKSDDPETPVTASKQSTPETGKSSEPGVDGEEDCWTQDRSRMAGTPPCGSDAYGPVEGNAKVNCRKRQSLR